MCLARRTLIGNDLRNGVLVKLFGVEVPGVRNFYLVDLPRMRDSDKLARFRRWLHDDFAADAEYWKTVVCAAEPAARTHAPTQARASRTR